MAYQLTFLLNLGYITTLTPTSFYLKKFGEQVRFSIVMHSKYKNIKYIKYSLLFIVYI